MICSINRTLDGGIKNAANFCYISDVVKGFYGSLMPLDIPINGWMKTALSEAKSKKNFAGKPK